MMSQPCDVPIVSGAACPGFHYKFDDCLAEAIGGWSLDGLADEECGDSDFEGYYVLFIVQADKQATIGEFGPDARTVLVPAGNYMLHTASTGRVSLWEYETPELARAEFEAAQTRYDLWERGCDPNDPAGHAACAEDGEGCLKAKRGCSCGMADYGAPGHDGHDGHEES